MTDTHRAARFEAMSRIRQQDPIALNEVAAAVTEVQGQTPFSTRYAIAVRALERLAEVPHD